MGFEFPALGLKSAVLEGADYGGADGDDPSMVGACAIDSVCGGGADCVALAVKAHVFESVNTEGRKGAETDVEGEFGDFDAFQSERIEQLGRKVQPCGGSGD